jgi:hypothetical protein
MSEQKRNYQDLNVSGMMVPRADLKPEYFDTLVEQKGYRMLWQQAMFCSCVNEQSGTPDYNCTVCYGRGYVYFGETITRALVTSISDRKEQERIGLHEVGAAYLTPLSKDNVGFRDRFIFLDFYTKFSEVLTVNGEQDIALRYRCESMIALRSTSGFLREGIDFELIHPPDDDFISSSKIRWKSMVPYEGRISVLYDIRPVYIAINPIHELRGTYSMHKGGGSEYFIRLPKQFQIKREDFIQDSLTGDV